MKLELPQGISPEQLKADLTEHFFAYKVTTPLLNKKMSVIQSGMSAVNVAFRKNELKLTASPNTQHPGILIAVVVGVLLGLLLALVVIAVAYVITNTKNKELEEEVADFLMEKYKIVQIN